MTGTLSVPQIREQRGIRMVTMKEVAESAGVSIATVSRVLNGKDRGRIKPEIAREIKRIAKDLGYRPNLVARNLKTRSSRILGFISDEIATTPFAGRIMLGAQDAARELGYILLTVNTGNDPDLERRQIGIVRQYGADGPRATRRPARGIGGRRGQGGGAAFDLPGRVRHRLYGHPSSVGCRVPAHRLLRCGCADRRAERTTGRIPGRIG